MEGSFHSATIRKVPGALIGVITRSTAQSSACSGGTLTVEVESLPWHVRYAGFSGTLPAIRNVEILIVAFKFHFVIAGVPCTTQTTAANPLLGFLNLGASGAITEFSVEEGTTIPLRGAFPCQIAGSGFFRGDGRFTLLGATNAVSIRLI